MKSLYLVSSLSILALGCQPLSKHSSGSVTTSLLPDPSFSGPSTTENRTSEVDNETGKTRFRSEFVAKSGAKIVLYYNFTSRDGESGRKSIVNFERMETIDSGSNVKHFIRNVELRNICQTVTRLRDEAVSVESSNIVFKADGFVGPGTLFLSTEQTSHLIFHGRMLLTMECKQEIRAQTEDGKDVLDSVSGLPVFTLKL